jgi:hypothetical protein
MLCQFMAKGQGAACVVDLDGGSAEEAKGAGKARKQDLTWLLLNMACPYTVLMKILPAYTGSASNTSNMNVVLGCWELTSELHVGW